LGPSLGPMTPEPGPKEGPGGRRKKSRVVVPPSPVPSRPEEEGLGATKECEEGSEGPEELPEGWVSGVGEGRDWERVVVSG